MARGQLYSPSSSSSHLEGQIVPLVVVGPVGPCEIQEMLHIALPVVEPPTIALLQKPGLEPNGLWHQGITFNLEIPMLSVPMSCSKGTQDPRAAWAGAASVPSWWSQYIGDLSSSSQAELSTVEVRGLTEQGAPGFALALAA